MQSIATATDGDYTYVDVTDSALVAPGTAAAMMTTTMANQLADVLKKHHCERVEAEGEPFDPNIHEAVGQEPSDEYPEGVVMRMLQVGYRLYDRVVRSAQVFISTGSDQEEDD